MPKGQRQKIQIYWNLYIKGWFYKYGCF